MVIRNTLEQTVLRELLPRSQIDVYVQVRGSAGRGWLAGSGASGSSSTATPSKPGAALLLPHALRPL